MRQHGGMPAPLPGLGQQITFLYASAPEASWHFYETVLELPLVQDQGSCRIYDVAGGRAFLGVCRARAERATDNPRAEGGVVVTFVTEQVAACHAALRARGVAVGEAPAWSEAYGVEHFFFRDPAGYLLEVQRFGRGDWPAPPG
ncbi:catechol 2,3-dioxygenase-like lactoylglutathione lyase family enzyme [Pseudoroseomonas cervicalis]|nr:catechol 2,3-dioxygenase-like lactoylglutathione lyase family enzyme [Pseudoroseomonas cervicalis]